ncbi:MAG: hypothetical protein ACJAWC_000383 [Yoonia sp.]|jgi:hypothetical protein
MMHALKSIARRVTSFRKREDGSSSIELVLILPFYMTMFLMAFEGGRISLNHVMLERGLDMTVRDVRIGNIVDPTHAELKEQICEYAGIIPDCLNQLQLEMVRMDVRAWGNELDGPIRCIDRGLDVQPAVQFTNGDNNELMVLQLCSLFDPVVPSSGLGKQIPKKSGGGYALAASAAFVMEPFQ